jgi:predicted AAA+ superfamily ATPase
VTSTIFDCCRPRDDVLSAALGDYAAELRTILIGKGPAEYTDPAQFFANTYPTKDLLRLLEAVGRRLSGAGNAEGSTIRLDSTFGGGKTHGMIALVHLARTPQAKMQ